MKAAWLALAVLQAAVATAEVASPAIEGPITGGAGAPFIASTTFDLRKVGYRQAEFFVAGTARAYTATTPLSSDGRWTALPGSTAAYRTRILVYRPIEARRFNGTVVVEWLNVSGGLDSAPDWLNAHTELVREGAVWVGVSAQRTGVEGGRSLVGLPVMPLKTVDPARYGSLVHPGDAFSYELFSQVAEALRRPTGIDVLGGLRVERVIAAGESQSAFRLVTYINAIQPLVGLYDGFLVHSRGTSGAPLSEAPEPAIAPPSPTFIRTDLAVPVLTFETETDLSFLLYASDRQPDTDRFRLWEVAGTAHADAYTVAIGATDRGRSPAATEIVVTSTPLPGIIECRLPVNS
ncbi:MAG TPA: alpha/beta hydrolase domain-containing protein, partial [Candidatus Binatia bacterium]|nr:alpha/beta hydrolase domain-containing protein [Candidatus Binatia bacterium]